MLNFILCLQRSYGLKRMTVCGDLHLMRDLSRQAIILVAGDKSGVSEKRFYKQLIKKADERKTTHLTQLKEEKEEEDQ